MKTVTTVLMAFSALCVQAQVEVDKTLSLTGTTGERRITNLEPPVAGTDAVNKDYVDGAVSAGGGSGLPTMLSSESSAAMNLGDAIRYCRNLEEDTFTDWRLPRFDDMIAAASTDDTVSSESSSNYLHVASYDGGYFGNGTASGTSSRRHRAMRLSDGDMLVSELAGSTSFFVRCVR